MYELNKTEADHLLNWYRLNRRELPWRDTGDIYDVWISEIMLQQTRVEAVKEYFFRFKKEIRDVYELAEIDDDVLMRLWEGLGYYSRARNLKKCAIELVDKYDGVFPEDERELLNLPGIGPYTAAAILSIGYGLPHAAIDGNVLRVMARYYGIREDIRGNDVKEQIRELIDRFYEREKIRDKSYIKDLSQAFMELGAIVCVPNGKPLCEKCPWNEKCACHELEAYDRIPYRSALKKRKIVEKTVFVIKDHDRFLLHRRDEKGLLAGMYEFLNIDEWTGQDEAARYVKDLGMDVLRINKIDECKHVFTHLEWHMHGYEIVTGDWNERLPDDCVLADREQLQKMAIPSAFRVYIDRYSLREE